MNQQDLQPQQPSHDDGNLKGPIGIQEPKYEGITVAENDDCSG